VKVVVCIKEVPDTEAYIKIGSDQKSMEKFPIQKRISRSGAIRNPWMKTMLLLS